MLVPSPPRQVHPATHWSLSAAWEAALLSIFETTLPLWAAVQAGKCRHGDFDLVAHCLGEIIFVIIIFFFYLSSILVTNNNTPLGHEIVRQVFPVIIN